VEVRDAVTGAPAALGAVGHVSEGAFRADLESNGAADPARLFGPWERAGNYTVTVQKPGYRSWTQANVRVTADRCHVRTVELRADLQPES
jgi:hypothetical protein